MTVYSNLKYDHPFSANATGTGALTKISSQTASSSSSLSFTTGIDSTYKEYVFKFINIHPSVNDAQFHFQGSTNGGSSYGITMTTTRFNAFHNEAGSSSGLTYRTGDDLAQSTSYSLISGEQGIENDECTSATLHLFDPSNTTFVKHFIATTSQNTSGDYEYNGFSAGYFNTTSAINAIDFKMSSGNIDSGTIIMYGVS